MEHIKLTAQLVIHNKMLVNGRHDVLTYPIGYVRTKGFSFNNGFHFQDLVCSVHVVTITTVVSYRTIVSFKSGFHFMDLVCSIHVVTIKTGVSYSNLSFL